MARDFAKKGSKSNNRKSPARKKAASRNTAAPRASNGWRWYGAGVLTGLFLSFLLYLGTLPPVGSGADSRGGPQVAANQGEEAPPTPRFDFYTLLPEQTIEVEDEPTTEAAPSTTQTRQAAASRDYYLLQAGSFRQKQDADRRRAELLLLGLEPRVEEGNSDNGRWFRVYLGPFESKSAMSKARSLTAQQNIDTLLLKRSG